MALPVRAYRKDIALMVAFNPQTPAAFTTFCGATGVSFSLTNEIQTERVADCDDLEAAIQTVKSYGAQDVSISINGTWARQNHNLAFRWAKDQLTLPFRLHFANAAVGDIEYLDGVAMLRDFTLDNIMNIDGATVSRSITLEVDGGVEETLRAV